MIGIIAYFFIPGSIGTFLAVIFLIGGPLVFLLVPAALASMAHKEKKLVAAVTQEFGTSKETKKCPECSKVIPEDATLCPYCGHDLLTDRNVLEYDL